MAENLVKMLAEIKQKLQKNKKYGRNIKSVYLNTFEKEHHSKVHINVETNLSEQEDCRELGRILTDIQDDYKNIADIGFHQYSYPGQYNNGNN